LTGGATIPENAAMKHWSREDKAAFVRSLPLAELHRHFDGSIRPLTLWRLSEKYYRAIPGMGFEEFKRYLAWDSEQDRTLLDYLDKFHIPLQYTQFYDNLMQIAEEIAADAYDDGVRRFELRINPIIHRRAGLTTRQVVHSVRKGLQHFCKEHSDFSVGIVVIAMRNHGGNMANILLREVAGEREDLHDHIGVVGFDIAGAERPFPPVLFTEAYGLARKMGLHGTVHVGEDEGPGKVWEAIECLKPLRLGHAVAAGQDPELMRRIASDRITVEVCLTSNMQTGAVQTLAEHPLGKFLAAGIRCALCTDNTTVSGTTLVDEYVTAIDLLSLTERDVRELASFAWESTFIGWRPWEPEKRPQGAQPTTAAAAG
jgi:adenosine deaminase